MDIDTYRKRAQASKARKYATRFESGAHKRINERAQRAVRKIFAALDECKTILDAPSGAGRFLAVLAGANRRVLAIDVAHDMLTEARQRRGGARAFYAQGDATRLPLAEGAVDCVFCNRLLHHILSQYERAVVLRELGRVSRRHVVVSFFDYHSFGTLRRVLKRLKGRKPKYDRQPTLEQFRAEVERCGFRVREIVPVGPVWVAEKFFVMEKQDRV